MDIVPGQHQLLTSHPRVTILSLSIISSVSSLSIGRITKQSPWLKYTRKPEKAKQNIHNYTRCVHRQNKKGLQTNTWIQFKCALTIKWPNRWSIAMGSWPRYLISPWCTLVDVFILEFYDTVTVLALKANSYSLILITTILFILSTIKSLEWMQPISIQL